MYGKFSYLAEKMIFLTFLKNLNFLSKNSKTNKICKIKLKIKLIIIKFWRIKILIIF